MVHLLSRKEHVLESAVKSYKVHWEMVMFSQRVMVAMVNSLGDIKTAGHVLSTLFIFFLIAHIVSHFVLSKTTLETICLISLLAVVHLISGRLYHCTIVRVCRSNLRH
eukprot:761455_1